MNISGVEGPEVLLLLCFVVYFAVGIVSLCFLLCIFFFLGKTMALSQTANLGMIFSKPLT